MWLLVIANGAIWLKKKKITDSTMKTERLK